MTTRELQLSGNARDYNWILEKYESGRLYISQHPVTPSVFEQLRILIRVVNDIYENHWDLDVEVLESNDINIKGIAIHFPEVTIRNSRRESHFIRDLFVKIPLNIGCIGSGDDFIAIPGNPYGGRTTWTKAEWSSSYSHSHISGRGNMAGNRLPFYGRFCTGSGHINDYIAQINAGEFSEQLVTRFLIQLMGFVSHESLEGTPYAYISNIYERSSSGQNFYYHPSYATTLYNKVLTAFKEVGVVPTLDFILEGGKYKLLDNDRFDSFLNSIPFSEEEKRRYLSFIDNTGRAWAYNSSPNSSIPNISQFVPYIFRNREIPATIIGTNDDEIIVTYKIHPRIKQRIKEEIEYEINRKTIRKSTIEKYNKVDNAREDIQPDQVLV